MQNTFSTVDLSEMNWTNQSSSYDRSSRRREARDMGDWQEQDFAREDAARNAAAAVHQVREEAADSMMPILCDGSGVVEEEYFDVDQTWVVKCVGCPACRGEEEAVEFRGASRMPVQSETFSGDSGRKVA